MCSVGLREMRRRLTQERNAGRQDAGATPASSRLLLHPVRSVFLRVADDGSRRISTVWILHGSYVEVLRAANGAALRMTSFFNFKRGEKPAPSKCTPSEIRTAKGAHCRRRAPPKTLVNVPLVRRWAH